MTTPADQMRTAADKIRALAIDATEGPWASEDPNTRWGDDRDHRIVGGGKILATFNSDHNGPLNADYAAAMHPGVGTALADWLEQAAHHYECGIRAADDVFHDDPAGREAFLTTGPGAPSMHALAVARALLGTPEATP